MEEVKISLTDTLSGHQDRVWCVAWNPKGTILASCGGDKTVRLWAKEDDRWICKMVLDGSHKRTIRRVAWSPCGQQIASASFDGTTCVWSQKSGEFECVATLEGHENEVKSVTWSAGGNLLATCSRDKSVWIWEVDEENDDFECASVITSHSQDVKCVKWHPTDDILASVSYDNTVKLYKEEADDWSCFTTLDSHSSTVWGLDFNASGSRLVTSSDDRTLKIWEADEQRVWKCVCTVSGYHDRPIYDVSWCGLTGLIASAGGDDSLRIFGEGDPSGGVGDPQQGPTFSCVASLHRAHAEELNAVCWNPTQPGVLATGSDDGIVKLWTVSASNTDSH